MLSTALIALAAVILDWILGEPRRWHPLVGFGHWARFLEHHCYSSRIESLPQRVRGGVALIVAIAPPTIATMVVAAMPGIGVCLSMLILYVTIGHRSLHDHTRPIAAALQLGQEEQARQLVTRLVSRDSAAINITAATTESVLENGNDGVFGALFWFLLAGAPGAVLYRLVNTLDAMWGYRNERYLHFGWAAARLDDLLNLIPARLTAATYALLGNTRQAWRCWRTQAPAWDSPNAGPVMAAGAGALELALGGPARYQGQWNQRPKLGSGPRPEREDIERSLQLVRCGVWMWLALGLIAGVVTNGCE
ncbi:MAG: adenosylcobinamide-phosphate synthase CbiB [Pseudomonadota bacterium]|nr:adenosylcobinamide-phosphate synthase CbiB [Pseudomonadota bacterium]